MSAERKLVYHGNEVELQRCVLYAHWHAVSELHHVCPESWWRAAGQKVQTRMAPLCPNCHDNVHVAIDALIKGHGVSLIPPRCVRLAKEAFEIAKEHGLTPRPTL